MIRDTLPFQLQAFQGLSRDLNMILFPHKKDVSLKSIETKKYCQNSQTNAEGYRRRKRFFSNKN